MSNDKKYWATLILVHGTWPRGLLRGPSTPERSSALEPTDAEKTWYEPNSKFAQDLVQQAGGGIQVKSLIWSGRNRIFDRFDAATRMAKRMEALAVEFPNRKRFVVAHSHGGSVALACAALLSPGARPDGIVAMGTPFLYADLRQPTWFQTIVSAMGFMILLSLLCMGGLFAPAAIWAFFRGEAMSDLEAILALFAGFATFYYACNFYNWTQIVWVRWWKVAGYRMEALSPRNLPCDFLVIRGQGDEASAALALSVLGPKFIRWLRDSTIESKWFQSGLKWFLMILYAIFLVSILPVILWSVFCGVSRISGFAPGVQMCAAVASVIQNPPRPFVLTIIFIIYSLLWGLPLLMGLIILSESLATTLMGVDSVIYGLRYRMTSETKPRRGNSTHIIEESDILSDAQTPGLSHSLYNLPDVTLEIARWISARSRTGPS